MRAFLLRGARTFAPAAAARTLAVAARAAKPPPAYVCSDCGHESNKWHGQCPSCRALNTVVEFRGSPSAAAAASPSWFSAGPGGAALRLVPLAGVGGERLPRTALGSPELDRLFGGGLTRGSAVLFSGAPGVGKSTLLLQAAALLAGGASRAGGAPYADAFTRAGARSAPRAPARVAYISGEESAPQIAARAARCGIDAPGLLVLNAARLEDVLDALRGAAGAADAPPLAAALVDSVQTLFTDALPGAAGSVSQVKECAVRLTAWAKSSGVPVILVGHVTKSGDVAGPRVLEHIVDTVLLMEGEEAGGAGAGGGGGGGGDGGGGAPALSGGHRIVRALKNRFGSTAEVGLFEMTDTGFAETDPAALFLSHGGGGGGGAAPAGCAVAVTAEGSRVLCVEVQALVSRSLAPFPRLRASGLAVDRVHLLAAVLGRFTRARVAALAADVLVNVVGGLRLSDPATDLAVALAIASSTLGVPLPRGAAFIGEVGLAGELRGVLRLAERVRAAAKLGFTTVYAPRAAAGKLPPAAPDAPVNVVFAASVAEVCDAVFGGAARGARRGARARRGGAAHRGRASRAWHGGGLRIGAAAAGRWAAPNKNVHARPPRHSRPSRPSPTPSSPKRFLCAPV